MLTFARPYIVVCKVGLHRVFYTKIPMEQISVICNTVERLAAGPPLYAQHMIDPEKKQIRLLSIHPGDWK